MKKYLIVFGLLGLIVSIIGFKTYHKPHEDIRDAKADYVLTAAELFAAYEVNEEEANAMYLDKVVVVAGTVREINEEDGNTNVMLESDDMMFGVSCQLDNLTKHKRKNFMAGEKVSLKGKCTGSLMDVVMVRCVEI